MFTYFQYERTRKNIFTQRLIETAQLAGTTYSITTSSTRCIPALPNIHPAPLPARSVANRAAVWRTRWH